MLFSNDAIRKYINANFLAAWENVRSVPQVTIDFGDGRTLKRTVLGNVATYICMPDGRVLDIIPGVNTPEAYLAALQSGRRLYTAALAGADTLEYHRVNRKTPAVYTFPAPKTPDFSKGMRLERPILTTLKPKVARNYPVRATNVPAMDNSKYAGLELRVLNAIARDEPAPKSREEESLEKDTLHNRLVRKPAIHRILSERAWKPGEITRRVYRDVLHCDLDDPYLGLDTIDFKGGGYESAPPVAQAKEMNR